MTKYPDYYSRTRASDGEEDEDEDAGTGGSDAKSLVEDTQNQSTGSDGNEESKTL